MTSKNNQINLKYDWEFNSLGIYDYRKPGPHDAYFNYIRLNDSHSEGDIVEAGVFRGKSLLATALLLKEIDSPKKVYGFDSFSGFPPIYHQNDHMSKFDQLFESGDIHREHYESIKKNLAIKHYLQTEDVNASTISSSGNFSNTSKQVLNKKIELLGLDNIVLVEGNFSDTMNEEQFPMKIFASMFDCDLFESYITTFNFVWPRLIKGGLCYLDEYWSLKFPGAKIACDQFLADHQHRMIMSPLKPGDQFERWSVVKL